MIIKYVLITLTLIQLNASNILEETYYINSHDINISSIVKNTKIDKNLFKIASNKYSKRIKSNLLISTLKQNGYINFKATTNYITFKEKSFINTTQIKKEIKKYYQERYEIIDIQDISVNPRGYLLSLPLRYTVHLKNRNYLFHNGVVSIKTIKNKKLFFDYTIKAKLPIYTTVNKLKKNSEISLLNTKRKIILLDKLRAKPIQHIANHSIQTKYQISKNTILTTKNTEQLDLTTRGSNVSVIFHNNGIDISFVAKALQNAKLGETITVEKNNNKKRLKVKIIGKNRAEMY